MIKHLAREWRFMLRQRYVLVLLLCSFVLSSFSILTGLNEVQSQRDTIARLSIADQTDRLETQDKYDDPGSLAYYSFHLSYSQPSSLAFASLGQRDIFPWKHRVRMLALEGQIYESDAQNAELAQAGKIDFTFVISALSPLLIILLFHDLLVSERTSGRHNLLVTTARTGFSLWGARAIVRFIALFGCLMLPLFIGAFLSAAAFVDVFIITIWSLIYIGFWVLLSIYLGKDAVSAPRIASTLIGIWALFAFVIPVLGDIAINSSVHSPKGADILLTQRETVNDAWDLPVQTTMQAFFAIHPSYKGYTKVNQGFAWEWYYAFQQVGDQAAKPLSEQYRQATNRKYKLAGYVALISPPMLFQRTMTSLAQTDAMAAIEYETQIRAFHKALRMFYYPWLFNTQEFDKERLSEIPAFDDFLQNTDE